VASKIMIRYFFKLIRFLIKVNIEFKNPKKQKLLIYDDESIKDLEDTILKNYKYFVLQTRVVNIKKIYISLQIFFKMLKYLKRKYKFIDSYFLALIEIIEPKIVLTFIYNDFKFFKFAKIKSLNKKIYFAAIQNGSTYQIKENVYFFKKKQLEINFNKKWYIPHFFCHGKYDIKLYKKYKLKISNFYAVGSLRLSRAVNKIKKNYKIKKNKYDLCLLSDFGAPRIKINNIKVNDEEMVYNGFLKLTKFTIKYAIDNKCKFIFLFKGKTGEIKWYEKNLDNKEFNFLMKNSSLKKEKKSTSSYQILQQSKLAISTMTTMLRENLSLNGKILSCNFTQNSIYDFPVSGISTINKPCGYDYFKKRTNLLLKMSKSQYLNKMKDKGNYLVNNETKFSTIQLITKKLNYLLNL